MQGCWDWEEGEEEEIKEALREGDKVNVFEAEEDEWRDEVDKEIEDEDEIIDTVDMKKTMLA